jgi:transposase
MKRSYQTVSSDIQRAIVADYQPGVRGSGRRKLAEKYGLPESTVQHVLERSEGGSADPIRPRGHKKRRLDSNDVAKLERTLEHDPLATNRELAASVHHVIAERTVSDYLARSDPPFTRKVIQDQEPEEMTDDWKAEGRRWVRKVKNIPLDRRIYVDETPVYANEAPHKGRSRKGQPIFRPRSRWAKKYTLHMYVKRTGVLHWELSDRTGNTEEIERVAEAAAAEMNEGDVVIWDRLGPSGRCRNPVAQHYSPTAHDTFHAHGVTVEFLPPKGKYFNPLELLFNDLKSHYIRPAFPRNGAKLTKQQIEVIISDYIDTHAKSTLSGFFDSRANGTSCINKGLI